MSVFSMPQLRWPSPLVLGSAVLVMTGCEPMLDDPADVAVGEDQAELDQAGASGPVQVLANPTTLANGTVTGLIASTGNLYWTTNNFNPFGFDFSVLLRGSKNNIPGVEQWLYFESSTANSEVVFGQVVFANPGTFFGYFVANYTSPSGVVTSQIKRVPLTGLTPGDPATIIANSPAPIGKRDLVTDGTTLFWVDAGGIRSVPLAGGPITTHRTSTIVTRLRVDSSFIYYGEAFLIFRKPKNGSPEQVVVSTSGLVTALHVDESIGRLFWGEQGGGVRSTSTTPQSGFLTHQAPIDGRRVTAVGSIGTADILWTDCVPTALDANINCRIIRLHAGVRQILQGPPTPILVGVDGHFQWDAASLYWVEVGALRKYVL